MSETNSPPPPPEDDVPPKNEGMKGRSREVQQPEITNVTRRILAGEAKKSRDIPADDRTDKDNALLIYDQLRTGKNLAGKDISNVQFSGDGLPLPAVEIPIGDTIESFKNKQLEIAGITSATEDGKNYTCYFKDAGTNNILFVEEDEEGNEDLVRVDSSDKEAYEQALKNKKMRPYEMPVPKATVADAQLVSEADKITDGLSEDAKKVVSTYIDTLPQSNPAAELPEAIDASLEQAATEQGIPTAEMMKKSLQAEEMTDETKKFLEKLDQSGKVLLDKEDFVEGMKLLGVDRGLFDKQTEALSNELVGLNNKLQEQKARGVVDTSLVERQIAAVNEQIALVSKADEKWGEKEASGDSPVGDAYEKLANGDIPPEAAQQIIDAISSGKEEQIMESMGPLLAALPETKDLDPETKEAVKKYMSGAWKGVKVGAKWGGIAILIALAMAAAGAVAVGGVSALGAGAARQR